MIGKLKRYIGDAREEKEFAFAGFGGKGRLPSVVKVSPLRGGLIVPVPSPEPEGEIGMESRLRRDSDCRVALWISSAGAGMKSGGCAPGAGVLC